MYAMMETTVANVVFISTQTVFLLIIAYFFKNFASRICCNCISHDWRNFDDW